MDGGRINQGLQPARHSAANPESEEQAPSLAQPQRAHVDNRPASGPSAASAAAPQSSSATPVPQIPSHRLGGPTVPRMALLNALAGHPFTMPASLRLREVQHPAVQPEESHGSGGFSEKSALTLTGEAACAHLSVPGNVPTVRELRIRDCRDIDLVNISWVLRNPLQSPSRIAAPAASPAAFQAQMPRGPSTAFELVLDKHAGARLTAIGFHALAGLHLSGITLIDLPIPADIAERLSMGRSSLSIKLSGLVDGQSDIYAISQMPTLRSLNVGGHPVSGAALAAFASHPSLTALRLTRLASQALGQLLENPKLRTLSVKTIVGDENEAFAALAKNTTLTSLRIGQVRASEHLVTLSRNTALISLDLELTPAARRGMPYLAKIPTLTTLAVSLSDADVVLTLADVQHLSLKTYAVLRFTMVNIEPAALMHIVAAQAKSLVLDYCFYITDQAINALIANPAITALSVIGCVNERQAFALARMPSLEKLTVDFASDSAIRAEANFMRTWTAAGKSLANLDLAVLGDEEDEAFVV